VPDGDRRGRDGGRRRRAPDAGHRGQDAHRARPAPDGDRPPHRPRLPAVRPDAGS